MEQLLSFPFRLRQWAQNLSAPEPELNISYQGEQPEDIFLETAKIQLKITGKKPDNYLWHSFRLLMRQ